MNKDTAIKLHNMYLELNPHRHDLRTAIETVLEELDVLQMNYTLLEERFDGSAEEKVDKLAEKVFELTEELERQKQIKKDMRHVAYEEGYIQGFAQAKFDIEMDKINEGEE